MTDDRKNRQSLLLPILIPVGSLLVIGAILFGFSRILLRVSSTAATATALAAAVAVVAIAGLTAARKKVDAGALFSMVGGVIGVAMLAGGTALLVGQPTEEEPAEPVPVVAITAPTGAAVDGFASTKVGAPAGVPFQIAFDNQDTQQHNVAIASDDTLQDVLFNGTIVTGPVQTTYDVAEPLEAGTYVFFCAVHPTTMTGTLDVSEGGGGGGGGGGVTVVAKGISFDTDQISLPADTPSTITFDNQDPFGHNIAIYEDQGFTKALWNGDIVEGPATVDYKVPPLKAGSYFFKCDIHANMNGTVEVGGPGGGGGPPPSGGPEPSSQSPPPTGGGGAAAVTLVASNLTFDTTTISLPANAASTITLDNQDAGIPHNLSIFVDEEMTHSVFIGDTVNGPATVDYQIDPLQPGTYYFRCDVHPTTMKGTVTVA